MLQRQPDFPPLFELGFHHLSMEAIEDKCVNQFPLSSTRKLIMEGFRRFVERLADCGVDGEIWVDGSFTTEKIDPKDIDVVVRCDGTRYNADERYREIVNWVIENQKAELKCDSYALLEYPEGHELHEEGGWWHAYWKVKWGFSREEDPKGIVVVKLEGEPK
ncbi:hypothetical protein A1351_02680 [Methylosinus sp. R-45379]|uniref:DUF6932 family protein n=1 Tax=Methylosinus sp. R-45379 TaxID=980563 RepID=UPI0007D78656|nr:hypothetical protein [Methylosinus sp. R-45379]OAI24904.1 hypothetical protein A1351_02680 [Methylosinus sp. R-45379]